MTHSIAPTDSLHRFHLQQPKLGTPASLESPVVFRPKMSVNQMTTYHWSFDDDINNFVSAGVKSIGVWRQKLEEFGEERGIDLLRESDLSVSSVSWTGGFTGANRQPFDDALDDAFEAIRIAAELKAGCVVVASGPRAGHTANHARRLLVQALRELSGLAGAYNVKLAVLPMHSHFSDEWTFLHSVNQTLKVLDEVDHPFVQMAFDAYHLHHEPRLIERIPRFVSNIALVQLSDTQDSPSFENNRCIPGDGKLPLPEIMSALINSGYRGEFEMQIWSDQIWNSDYKQLIQNCNSRFQTLMKPFRGLTETTTPVNSKV